MKLRIILSALDRAHWSYLHKRVTSGFRERSLEYRTWLVVYKHKTLIGDITLDGLRREVGHTGSLSSYRNVISRLCSCIEEAIVSYELMYTEEGRERYHFILASFYKRRGAIGLYDEHMNHRQAHLGHMTTYDPMSYLHQVEHHYDYIYSEISYESKKESYDILDQSIKALSMYVSGLLEIESDNSNTRYHRRQESDNMEEYPWIGLLSDAREVVNYGAKEDFRALWSMIRHNHLDMPKHIVQIMLIYANNYCYPMIRRGHKGFYQRLLAINEFGVEYGYLLSQGLLSEKRFINMIELKSYFDTEPEVIGFINRWSGKISAEADIAPLLSMAHAWRHFGNGRYDHCVEALQEVRVTKDRYWLQLMRKWLLLCSLSTYVNHRYYEVELISTETYLKRNKMLIGRWYQGSMNLIKILRMIHRKDDLNSIMGEISSMQDLVMRYWLNNQVREGHAYI